MAFLNESIAHPSATALSPAVTSSASANPNLMAHQTDSGDQLT